MRDPKEMPKAAGGSKDFILNQIKAKETKPEVLWAGLGTEDFKMASV